MATRLKLYTPPLEETEAAPEPDVRVRLGDLLPLVAMAQRMNFIWLKDFLDDEVAVSSDLYEVLQAFRSSRPTSAFKSSLFVVFEQIRFAELTQIDAPAKFPLRKLQAHFQLAQFRLNDLQFRSSFVADLVPRYFGVTELSLQRREQVQRVAVAARLRDLPLFFAENHRQR